MKIEVNSTLILNKLRLICLIAYLTHLDESKGNVQFFVTHKIPNEKIVSISIIDTIESKHI